MKLQSPHVDFDLVIKTQEDAERIEKVLVLKRLNEEMNKVWENPLLARIEED